MRKLGWILGVVLLAGTAGSAMAEIVGEDNLAKGWEIRAGMFFPQHSDMRDAKGDAWLTLGAERPFYEKDNWLGTVSIDYYGTDGAYSIPIAFNLRGSTEGLRYGVGAGPAVSQDPERGMLSFGYNLLVGYQLRSGTSPVNIDLRYLGTAKSEQKLDGWALTVGFGF